jgi:hypothetical protein
MAIAPTLLHLLHGLPYIPPSSPAASITCKVESSSNSCNTPPGVACRDRLSRLSRPGSNRAGWLHPVAPPVRACDNSTSAAQILYMPTPRYALVQRGCTIPCPSAHRPDFGLLHLPPCPAGTIPAKSVAPLQSHPPDPPRRLWITSKIVDLVAPSRAPFRSPMGPTPCASTSYHPFSFRGVARQRRAASRPPWLSTLLQNQCGRSRTPQLRPWLARPASQAHAFSEPEAEIRSRLVAFGCIGQGLVSILPPHQTTPAVAGPAKPTVCLVLPTPRQR